MSARSLFTHLAAVVALAVGLAACDGASAGGASAESEAHQLVAQGALLLDVRTPSEFASGHLPNAVNIPVQELGKRIGEAGPKDRAIVVYCRSGRRSAMAKSMLQKAGYAKVLDIGPMSNW
ncbi:rhodanese-like domain-containing protein [Myxococcota bacterium]|nr:rhodanese-like domain-containing protein [Myxococcota bacterium]